MMKQNNWFTMTSIKNNLKILKFLSLCSKNKFWVALELSMFLNIPLLTIESRFLFIGLPLFSLKERRLSIFGRGSFGGDGVRPVVLSFRRISPTSTGVLPFRLLLCRRPVRLFMGHFGPTVRHSFGLERISNFTRVKIMVQNSSLGLVRKNDQHGFFKNWSTLVRTVF